MSDLTRVRDLEHATIRPLGEYPDHCGACWDWHELQKRQAACSHEHIESVDVTSLGGLHRRISWCRDCRLPVEDA